MVGETAKIVSVEVALDSADETERFRQVVAEGIVRELVRKRRGVRVVPEGEKYGG